MASRTRSGVVYTVIVVVAALVAAVVIGLLWNRAKSHFTADQCTFGSYQLDPEQTAIASTMVGVVTTRSLPERAAVLVLAAGMQESKLRNLAPNAGDRDSVGVLQQRPSQGWGTPTQLNNVHFATGAFLDALLKVNNWQTLDLAEAVQAVQISADGSAYAQHEAEAQALADALTGKRPAAITCSFRKPTTVAPVATVAAQLRADLPVNTPTAAGLTVRVPGAGWQTAAWLVANANRLGIDNVAYDGKQWSRAHGWQGGTATKSAVVATMYHP
ncbi:MAG: hypothetical protein QOK11_3124 [Pseudonocardiales bacterium]|jgi:hypothetical protein|nr:hypothetical protein [Pseudonocardiales bacterium]